MGQNKKYHYSLPNDIIVKLKILYPQVADQIPSIVESIFNEIVKQIVENGSCAVKRFGTFRLYKYKYGEKESYRIRLKFTAAKSLRRTIANDLYALFNTYTLPVEGKTKADVFKHLAETSERFKMQLLNKNDKELETLITTKYNEFNIEDFLNDE